MHVCICVCAHSCTCTHALPPGGRCSRAPAGVPTVLVSWGPMAFAVNGQLPRPRHTSPPSGARPSTGKRLPAVGLSSVSQAWDTLAFSSCAPRQPQALRSGYLALSLLLALGTQARRGPEPLPQGEGGGVPSLGLLLPPPPHLESTPVRDAQRAGRLQGKVEGKWEDLGCLQPFKDRCSGFLGSGLRTSLVGLAQ